MERRTFVKTLLGGGAVGMLAPRIARALGERVEAFAADVATAAGSAGLWARVKQEFLLAPDLVHLNCGSVGATPLLVLDGVTAAMCRLETDPVHQLWGPLGEQAEAVRAQATTFLNADKDEVAITRNTTEGMNTVASGLELRSGDEILTTDHEHAGGLYCWQHLAARLGVRIVQVKLPVPPRNKAEILNLLSDAITPRTRVCSVSHVDSLTGMRLPLAELAELTRPRDILLVCDGAQAPGMLPIDVRALGVDTYASSSHKWMLAPKGSGLLYIRQAIRDRICPAFLHAGMRVYTGSTGTRNVPHILGHGLAMDLHCAIGRERVADRCAELSCRLREGLAELPGLRVLRSDDPTLSSPMFSVALLKGRNSVIVDRLYREHRIVAKTVPSTLVVDPKLKPQHYNAIRFSTHIFNNEADIDRAVAAMAKVMS